MKLSEKEIRKKERVIGKRAANAVEYYLKFKIKKSLNIRNIGAVDDFGNAIKPILKATTIKPKVGQYKLLGLNLNSNKYAFIHHFGVKTQRSKHTVTSSKKTTFIRSSHPFIIKPKGFFDHIYERSGAIKILSDGLSETRVESIKIELVDYIKNLNYQNG